MKILHKDFSDFLKLLISHKVRYLIVGGYAVAYHGYVRATGDLDIFVDNAADNAKALVEVFKEFGFNLPDLKEAIFTESGKMVRIGYEPVRIEVLNKISGVGFLECYNTKIIVPVDGMLINFIDRDMLLKNKRASARDKDLLDVRQLENEKR